MQLVFTLFDIPQAMKRSSLRKTGSTLPEVFFPMSMSTCQGNTYTRNSRQQALRTSQYDRTYDSAKVSGWTTFLMEELLSEAGIEMDDSIFPPLPESVAIPDESGTDAAAETSFVPLYHLSHGCYFTKWIPTPFSPSPWYNFNGVTRVERHTSGITASSDLYFHLTKSPDPNPKHGIPIFPRQRYVFYFRITRILEWCSLDRTFTLGFERYLYHHSKKKWYNQGKFTARMSFRTAPSSYPKGAIYMSGYIRNTSGKIVGYLMMGKVSNYLRKAIVEVDRVGVSEHPRDNGSGIDWRDIFKRVDWDVLAYQSHTNLPERSGISWSNAELHGQMLDTRYTGNLDREWRYHLLCVRRLDATSRGIMYDHGGTDSNKLPREGAAISSHWVFPKDEKWGTVQGQRFGASPAPYFRTAVHEIGHAMGLLHNFTDNGLMNVTPLIAASPGTFPSNILWRFNPREVRQLKHAPDPWIRPGMIPFAAGPMEPISPTDRLELSESLSLEVKPLMSAVPIGAPVRVGLKLRNISDASLNVPPSLSLKSGHVCGTVVGPGDSSRGFKSVILVVDEFETRSLEPNAEISGDLTLLRGADGALFTAPGLHQIRVEVRWEADNIPVCVRGSSEVMVQPAVTDSHAEAALKTLSSPDLLLTLALGGDHLKEGLEALQVALSDEKLAPHYAVIEAKRIGRRFRTRDANPIAAMKYITNKSVMSKSEVRSVALLAKGVPNLSDSALSALKRSAMGDKSVEEMVKQLM